jgi:hypothetical protein
MDTCTWTELDNGFYEAECNEEWYEFMDGTPKENSFQFCPFCGKPLVEKFFVAETDKE